MTMKLHVVFYLFYLQFLIEGQTSPTGHLIHGGRRAYPNEFPNQVVFRWKGQEHAHCGGIILNDKWIMSAAHCFAGQPQDVKQLDVFVGTIDLTERPAIELGVKFAITHPKYDEKIRNDIALIRTERSYSGSDKVYLANPDDVYIGQEATVVGFGLTNSSGYPSKYLKTANITILDNSVCEKFAPWFWDSKVMLCAGDTKEGTSEGPCSSDSGGPLLVKKEGSGHCCRNRVLGTSLWRHSASRGSIYSSIYRVVMDQRSDGQISVKTGIPSHDKKMKTAKK